MGDLHPIVVHFPVALLTLYALFELLSFHPKIRNNKIMFYIKFTFLLIGSVGTMAAILTGEASAEGINSKLIDTHEQFAEMTRNIFVVLSVIYLAKLYVREKQTSVAHALPPFLQNILAWIAKYADKIFVPQVLAVVGLFLVTITGALGGAITYGRDADPIVKRSVSTFVK